VLDESPKEAALTLQDQEPSIKSPSCLRRLCEWFNAPSKRVAWRVARSMRCRVCSLSRMIYGRILSHLYLLTVERSPGQIAVPALPTTRHTMGLNQRVQAATTSATPAATTAAAHMPQRRRGGAGGTSGATAAAALSHLAAMRPPTTLLAALPVAAPRASGDGASPRAPQAPPPSLRELLDLFHAAHAYALAWGEAHPDVANVMKLARRIQSNAKFVEQQLAAEAAAAAAAGSRAGSPVGAGARAVGQAAAHAGSRQPGSGAEPAAPAPSPAADHSGGGTGGGEAPLTSGHIQGMLNNLRGFASELQAMSEAPRVVAVQRRFRGPGLQQPKGAGVEGGATATGPDGRGGGGEGCGGRGGSGGGEGDGGGGEGAGDRELLEVEVDVVANGGMTWIEVKGGQVGQPRGGAAGGRRHVPRRRRGSHRDAGLRGRQAIASAHRLACGASRRIPAAPAGLAHLRLQPPP
jgi:hypothetical protein